jgi:hypothetical protein
LKIIKALTITLHSLLSLAILSLLLFNTLFNKLFEQLKLLIPHFSPFDESQKGGDLVFG